MAVVIAVDAILVGVAHGVADDGDRGGGHVGGAAGHVVHVDVGYTSPDVVADEAHIHRVAATVARTVEIDCHRCRGGDGGGVDVAAADEDVAVGPFQHHAVQPVGCVAEGDALEYPVGGVFQGEAGFRAAAVKGHFGVGVRTYGDCCAVAAAGNHAVDGEMPVSAGAHLQRDRTGNAAGMQHIDSLFKVKEVRVAAADGVGAAQLGGADVAVGADGVVLRHHVVGLVGLGGPGADAEHAADGGGDAAQLEHLGGAGGEVAGPGIGGLFHAVGGPLNGDGGQRFQAAVHQRHIDGAALSALDVGGGEIGQGGIHILQDGGVGAHGGDAVPERIVEVVADTEVRHQEASVVVQRQSGLEILEVGVGGEAVGIPAACNLQTGDGVGGVVVVIGHTAAAVPVVVVVQHHLAGGEGIHS